MSHKEEVLSAPEEFPFPFEPYSIQKQFMTSLYSAIEERKIGIFESPTGTGKSLSLICGSLTWLKDHEEREERRIDAILSSGGRESASSSNLEKTGEDEPLWVKEFAEKNKISAEIKLARSMKERKTRSEKEMKMMQKNLKESKKQHGIKYGKRKLESNNDDEVLALMKQARMELEKKDLGCEEGVDEMYALDEYESDEDPESNKSNKEEEQEEEQDGVTRIYFCSRTHSQLTQFIHELKKSPYGKTCFSDFPLSVVSLASRKSFCINEDVKKLFSIQQINDKCLELQKNLKEKQKKKDEEIDVVRKKRVRVSNATCCYYSNSKGMDDLTSKIVEQISDIEDIVKEGRTVRACPYYATRRAVSFSQLVALPYQTLLHKPTRIATGINLKNSIVIIDEAHNLVEAINNMYSCQVSLREVEKSLSQLQQYAQKFNKRLKAKNLFYVKQILFILRHLAMVMVKQRQSTSPAAQSGSSLLLTINQFLFKASLDNINFHKILRYCQRSKISKKLSGFFEKMESNSKKTTSYSSVATFLEESKKTDSKHSFETSNDVMMRSPLMRIESFLMSLTSPGEDGRIVISTDGVGGRCLKYVLMNPAFHFKDLLEECRSVIVAGGTMQPSSCLIDQLIGQAEPLHRDRVFEFSCGHVIDGAKQLLPIALSSGPSGESFEFTFEKRTSLVLVDELGRLILNMINIIPGGLVCFFPSYKYEDFVYKRWQNTGLIEKLDAKKKIFREPKNSGDVDKVLIDYSKCIRRATAPTSKLTGALLLSIVGGKMSEGINFSDDLGRCVIMVGLPYPNLHSPELKEKMRYLDQNMRRDTDGRKGGQVHYENLCMKAVNQSIGRAIRHKDDYAVLLLADLRYGKSSVSSKLPSWIGRQLRKVDRFGAAFGAVKKVIGQTILFCFFRRTALIYYFTSLVFQPENSSP
ncbi:ATP-dependent DNA helicase DDX11-like isoform X2 [Clavelina lepadiformis]|uniref:ATP-dependent DNA helicase DDX11-like isoform X2 n=1 Tax=Clavelina lepadiformis TaxID=159417 RepID=UPI0040413E59